MTAENVQDHRARFRRLLAYIDVHLHDELTVERLSRVAAWSKFHFHRQFAAFFGIGPYPYVQLCRLKRASYRLAFRSRSSIIDIALASGYGGPEAFCRAFKKCVGQSPSEFRRRPQWDPWHARFEPLSELRSHHMKPEFHAERVEIIDFKATKVAVLEHRGDPRLIGDSLRRFIAWRKQNRLPPAVSATFNILYDDPAGVAPEDYRLDLCAATDRDVAGNAFGVVGKTIPAGRCAMLRHVGSDDLLGALIAYLYLQWLPQSGERLRDFPVYVQRIRFFPDVPENEAVTDVFLPLRSLGPASDDGS